jgi:hypothetical protein
MVMEHNDDCVKVSAWIDVSPQLQAEWDAMKQAWQADLLPVWAALNERLKTMSNPTPILCPHGIPTSWQGTARAGDTLPTCQHCEQCNPDAATLTGRIL